MLRLFLMLAMVLGIGTARAADPDALWKIAHGKCVPDQQQNGLPAPCAMVDLWRGEPQGYVILKDIVGRSQFLLIATARLSGIESPELLAPDAPDFWADAWSARRFTRALAGRPLARDEIGLAINSVHGRTQDQFHIHIDCLRADVTAALRAHLADIGTSWSAFPVPLAGQTYQVMRLPGRRLADTHPFRLLARMPDAASGMGEWTLAVAGANLPDGPGFVLLAEKADLPAGDVGSAEALQDHACGK